MYGYRGPAVDHSLLSPNGRISKRARAAAMQRHEEAAARWWAKTHPEPTPEEQEATARAEKARTLRLSAANLRELAARGMHPRKYPKEAARLEREAAALEATP